VGVLQYGVVTLLAVTGFQFSLFLHITAVVVGFGSSFAQSVTFPVAMKLDRRHLPYVHRLQLTLNTFFVQPALVIVIATGIYQASDADYDFGALWLSGAFAIVIAIGALTGASSFRPTAGSGPWWRRRSPPPGTARCSSLPST
jgi:hypothetical protein